MSLVVKMFTFTLMTENLAVVGDAITLDVNCPFGLICEQSTSNKSNKEYKYVGHVTGIEQSLL